MLTQLTEQAPAFYDKLEDLKDHLLTAPLSVWLDVLRRSDVEEHLELIEWMIRQPECDLTLAQMAFYRCRPRLALRKIEDVSAALAREATLCAEIADRCLTGTYPDRKLYLRIGELSRQMMTLRTVFEAMPARECRFDVPPAFFDDVEGAASEVPSEWSVEENEDIWSIYSAADLSVPKAPSKNVAPRAKSEDHSVLLAFTDMLLRPHSTPKDL